MEKTSNIKLISKITGEISSYYLKNGVKNFQIKIDFDNISHEYIIYTFGYITLSELEVNEIKNTLSIHNDSEYDHYWELLGEGEYKDELILLARICDSISMNYEDEILELALKKSFT